MRLFANMKIGVRLALGFAFVLGLMCTMSALGIWRLGAVANGTQAMVVYAENGELSREWLRGTAVNATRAVAVAKSSDPEVRKFFQDEMSAQSAQISKIQEELERRLSDDKGKAGLKKVADQRKLYVDVRNEAMKLQKEGADQADVIKLVDSKMLPALNAYIQSVKDVVDYQKSLFEESNTTIQKIEDSGRVLLLALGGVALVIGVAAAWSLTRSITRPLAEAVHIARTVAAGDLTSRIEPRSNDETGQLIAALKEMNTSLVRLVAQVRSSTETIVTASTQISAGNTDLSSRTEQQASSLEETASSMEELTSTVRQNADNAQQANQLAHSASSVAVRGGQVVSQVVDTMGAINDSARKIADIIGVIDGIAFQTNILALNAAVEAARAGEQGRGFAVVASEVRNLAQRSAAAAKEIKALINDSAEKVDTGARLVDQAGATMDEVVESVKRMTDIMSEITAASREQASGIGQVNDAITQMDQVTQQNAALVEEASAAAESLKDQAASLARTVGVFRLDASQQLALVN